MAKRQLFIVLLGFPGSGKSYFAKQLVGKTGAVRLNGDSMKVALYGSYAKIREKGLLAEANRRGFSALDYAAEEILRAGHDVIYDANNNKRSVRRKHELRARQYGALPVVVWLKVSDEVAKQRSMTREHAADQLRFDEIVYRETIERQKAHFDAPGAEENTIEIDGTLPFEQQFENFQKRLKVFS
jgi:predicted kinase